MIQTSPAALGAPRPSQRGRFLHALLCAFALLVVAGCGRAPDAGRMLATSSFLLPADVRVDGVRVTEISGLAWDADEGILYGISDGGFLFHFRLEHAGGLLTAVQPLRAIALRDPVAGSRARPRPDAEGVLALHAENGVRGDTELLVAVESETPRVLRIRPDGSVLGEMRLPSTLAAAGPFRWRNLGLETVAWHAEHGLLTLPEYPPWGAPGARHTVYGGDVAWTFAAAPGISLVKGIDVLGNGDLLLLEASRPWISRAGWRTELRRLRPSTCAPTATCATAAVATVAEDSVRYEGMTLLDAYHVLLASDNDGSRETGTTFSLLRLPRG